MSALATAAALEQLGGELPSVHSGHNNYYLWGPPGARTSLVITVGFELEQLTGIRVRRDGDLPRAVARLRRTLGGSDVVVTRGAEGMTIFEGQVPVDVPIVRSEVFDVQGAGDTSIAALALTRLVGGSLLEAVVVANAAAGVVVGKVGTATATPDEICALLPAAAEAARRGGPR